MKPAKKPVVFVSTTIYGIEELLERVYSLLTVFGYEVWLSHKGTVPVFSNKSAFENCIAAVEKCDLFLGLITPYYGSGIDEQNGISISHRELRRALELKKPRWLLSHDHVVFARTFLEKLGYKTPEQRKNLTLQKSQIFGDLRVIDMYEEAVLSEIPLRERQGNWVQKYKTDEDALVFTSAQFSRFQEVEAFLQESLSNPSAIIALATAKGGRK
jgi:hypothetical protein